MLVQVCNTGFIPDKVNFAMRIARNGGGTQARGHSRNNDFDLLIMPIRWPCSVLTANKHCPEHDSDATLHRVPHRAASTPRRAVPTTLST